MLVKISPENHGADLGPKVSHGHPARVAMVKMVRIHQMKSAKVNHGHLAQVQSLRMALHRQMKNVQGRNLLKKMDIVHDPVRLLKKDDRGVEVDRAEVEVARLEAIVVRAKAGKCF